jgi:UDP-glucose 4-epimerase
LVDAEAEAPPLDPPGPVWVVGAGGLLGGAVVRRLAALGFEARTVDVPWLDPSAAVVALRGLAAELPESGATVYWCAGAGVVGSDQDVLDVEVATFRAFLDAWRPVGSGNALFLASSAGGVYAGSAVPPFTEDTVPVPISPYGHAKLVAEEAARDFAEQRGVALLVGRISNLYGPGQDISKPQGLISQLCRSQITRQPLSIYVSLDTMRDYLFVDDAAVMVTSAVEQVRRVGGTHLKVLASERSTTIGAIIGGLHRITRRRPPVVLGASPNARFQVSDLRLRSVSWPPTTGLARTPLPVGVAATLTAVGRQLRASAAS